MAKGKGKNSELKPGIAREYTDQKTGEIKYAKGKDYYKQFSAEDRFKYRADKVKKGSTYVTSDGEIKEYSDFTRGKMFGVNQGIKQERYRKSSATRWRSEHPEEYQKWVKDKKARGEWREKKEK